MTHTLLRRLDTDFVNLSPIVAYSGAPYPVLSTIPNATVISRGSAAVAGTWVPLSAAQAYVRDHPVADNVLDVFLSAKLFERFPSALQDFARSSTSGRTLNQFGPHFGSTLQATQLCSQSERRETPDISTLLTPTTVTPPDADADAAPAEQPLSTTEQQMFSELCVTTEWDKDKDKDGLSPPPSPLSDVPDSADMIPERPGRPLRRSKRVADAMIAAQSSTRSRRRT